jgi:hypothetical protein
MNEVAAAGEEFRDDLRPLDTAARRARAGAGDAAARRLLFPAVPHYRLPALHRLLRVKGALAGAELRDLGATLGIVFAARAARSTTASTSTCT